MGKAQRIAPHLWTWLPRLALPKRTQFALAINPGLFAQESSSPPLSRPPHAVWDSRTISRMGLLTAHPVLHLHSRRRPPLACFMRKTGTRCLAPQFAWIAARAGPVLDATAYRREAMRLLLWLQYQAGCKTFARRDVNDCGDCMALLQNIPAPWISRVRAQPGAPGWAFADPSVTRATGRRSS